MIDRRIADFSRHRSVLTLSLSLLSWGRRLDDFLERHTPVRTRASLPETPPTAAENAVLHFLLGVISLRRAGEAVLCRRSQEPAAPALASMATRQETAGDLGLRNWLR